MRTKTPQLAERILDAAARLFASQRFHAVRMDDIAAEAEVSKGTLYSYFRDKDELYHDLLASASRGMVAALYKAAEGDRPPRDKLVLVVAAILDYFNDKPHLLDLIQRVESLTENEVDFPWQDAREVCMKLVQDLFDEGRQVGAFLTQDPELATLLLLGGLRALIRFGKNPRDTTLPERVVDAVLHGVSVPISGSNGPLAKSS
jgi:AcrR family transcriptional regulator